MLQSNVISDSSNSIVSELQDKNPFRGRSDIAHLKEQTRRVGVLCKRMMLEQLDAKLADNQLCHIIFQKRDGSN